MKKYLIDHQRVWNCDRAVEAKSTYTLGPLKYVASRCCNICMIFCLCVSYCFAQTNTNYGMNAGNAGNGNTCIGSNTGDIVTGTDNTVVGVTVGYALTLGSYNTLLGGRNTGVALTTETSNTLLGYLSGEYLTSSNNTFVGSTTGRVTTTGQDNTFIGFYVGRLNTTSNGNTSIGKDAFFNNTTGYNNATIGYQSLFSSTTSQGNVAIGYKSIYASNGSSNIGIGGESLLNSSSGAENMSLGNQALLSNTSGTQNIGIGASALTNNTTGSFNTALGAYSGPNTANLSNSGGVGSNAVSSASAQIRVGNTTVGSISGQVAWSWPSDGRFKKDIKDDVAGLEFIQQLKPVSYVFDRKSLNAFLGISYAFEPSGEAISKRESGFLAQDVELVVNKCECDFNGVVLPQNENDHYSLRYATFVVPLVKSVQQLDAKIQELETAVGEQQRQVGEIINQKLETKRPDVSLQARESSLFLGNLNFFSDPSEIEIALPRDISNARVIVFDLEGSELRSIPINGRGTTIFNVSSLSLSPGSYICVLIADEKQTDLKRVIITR
jgi:trimeric autotransporter adhesin